MKPVISLFFIGLILHFMFGCKNKTTVEKYDSLSKDSIVFLYIYNSENERIKPIDSLMLMNSGYEKSLVLYENCDSICKTVDGMVFFSVFKLNKNPFAVIIDTMANVYKFNGKIFEKIIQAPFEIGISKVTFQKLDLNGDYFEDLIIQIPSGGTAGMDCLILFYNPDLKTLVYDHKTELRNVELNLKEKKIISHYNQSSTIYKIEKYSFLKIE